MSLNLTTASGVLKDDYQPAAREQLNGHFALLNQIERNTKDTDGTAAVISLHVKRSSGVGARPEGGTLPTAGNQTHVQERISLKNNYGRIEVSGQSIKFLATDKGSFVRAVENETKGIVNDLKRDVNRQCYTAASGAIGTTTATPNTTTVTVDSKSTVRRLEAGMKYDIVEASTDVIVMTVQVTSATIAGTVWTMNYTQLSAGVGTAASGNRIVVSGVVPSGNYEILGLSEIVDSTGTLHNVNPSTYGVWSSYERAVTVAPSDSLFEEALDEISIAAGEDPNLIVVSHSAARAYSNSLKTQKRFDSAPLDLKGGFKAVTVSTPRATIGLMAERDCDESTAYIVNTNHLVQFEASDWEFMDEDGQVLSRVQGKDAYEATLYKYHELATDKRNSHGKITGLVV